MPNNRSLWAGSLYGTNTANLFAEFEVEGEKLEGKIRVLDPNYGLAIYEVEGTSGDIVEFSGKPIQVPEGKGEAFGKITGKAALSQDGVLRGEWDSTIGTAGTFDLHPHGSGVPARKPPDEASLPEQLVTHNIQVGAVRLYKEDIDKLVQKLQADFSRGRPVVTFVDGGTEYTKYVDGFLEQVKDSRPLRYLKIQIQEPEAHGINKIAVVELNADSTNEVRVQGVRDSWVHGQCNVLENALRSTSRNFVTTFKKFGGLTFSHLVLLALLVVLPEFSDWIQRALFLTVVVLLLGIIQIAHRHFIPTTLIYIGQKPPGLRTTAWPSILSWLIAASATAVGSYVFWLLQK